MRNETELQEQIDDLKSDIEKYRKQWVAGELTYEEFLQRKDRYFDYIECFEFTLGLSDCYGRTFEDE